MASAINEIISTVGEWDVYYDSDVFVKSVYGNKLKTYTGTPETPVRIISIINPDASGGEGFVALGKTQRADWQIADLLLIRPTSHGGALRNSEPQIRNYLKNYITQVQNDRSPTAQSFVEEVNWTAGNFTYGDEIEYYGVNIILSIGEIISA
jgi:hypothetical protein